MTGDASEILLALHGSLLRLVCARTRVHFQGLAAAARWLRREGLISNNQHKKLAQLDVVAAFIRHATIPLAAQLEWELTGCLSRLTDGRQHGQGATASGDAAAATAPASVAEEIAFVVPEEEEKEKEKVHKDNMV